MTAATPIEMIQESFTKVFPFLQLKFPPGDACSAARILEDINPSIRPGTIEFSGATTVNELEEIFKEKFELHVSILRKAGNIWIYPTMTRDWPLSKQNQGGKDLSAGRK